MSRACCLLLLPLLLGLGCRTPTYDERMAPVDSLYSQGDYAAAAAKLDEATDGKVERRVR